MLSCAHCIFAVFFIFLMVFVGNATAVYHLFHALCVGLGWPVAGSTVHASVHSLCRRAQLAAAAPRLFAAPLPPLCALELTAPDLPALHPLPSAELELVSSSGSGRGRSDTTTRSTPNPTSSAHPSISGGTVSRRLSDTKEPSPSDLPQHFMEPRMVESPHPALLAPEQLYKECELKHTRGSGPGGQHRNKVSIHAIPIRLHILHL